SPAHKRAAEYMRDRLAAYGLANARLEPWKFGRGWTLEKLTIEMVEPRYLPLLGYADGWSASMSGEIVGAPAYATSAGRGRGPAPVGETPQQRNQRVTAAMKAAGAAVILKPSTGEHGTVFVTGRDEGPGAVPSVTL